MIALTSKGRTKAEPRLTGRKFASKHAPDCFYRNVGSSLAQRQMMAVVRGMTCGFSRRSGPPLGLPGPARRPAVVVNGLSGSSH